MRMTYGGHLFLTDPMLAPKDDFEPVAGIARNPTIELPFPAKDVLEGVEAVLVSHDHPDHFDTTAGNLLPREIPLFCQPRDEGRMAEQGSRNVIPVDTSHIWQGISIVRTGGLHGTGKVLEFAGEVSGFVLQAEGEPTVYWVGDSIWCKEVEETIRATKPDVIITHSGGAEIPGYGVIIMDDEQTIAAAKAAPEATVVAVHLEALDHCRVSRETLRKRADQEGIPSSRLIIPGDGETLPF